MVHLLLIFFQKNRIWFIWFPVFLFSASLLSTSAFIICFLKLLFAYFFALFLIWWGNLFIFIHFYFYWHIYLLLQIFWLLFKSVLIFIYRIVIPIFQKFWNFSYYSFQQDLFIVLFCFLMSRCEVLLAGLLMTAIHFLHTSIDRRGLFTSSLDYGWAVTT